MNCQVGIFALKCMIMMHSGLDSDSLKKIPKKCSKSLCNFFFQIYYRTNGAYCGPSSLHVHDHLGAIRMYMYMYFK